MMSCEDIPQLSLQAWKTKIPVLTAVATVVPAFDWLKFKTDVNKTIGDIITSIGAKKPPVGSLPEDWLAFQNSINSTFSDLRNKFTTLHPKVITNVSLTRNLTDAPSPFDWMGLKDDVSKTVSDIMDSIIANKPAAGSLPADWLAYRKKINDSLLNVKKKFKLIHPKPVLTKKIASDSASVLGEIPTIDWVGLRNDINATISDVVKSLNSSKPLPGSTPADWFAFRKKVNDSLIGIKNKFAGLHPKPIGPLEKLGKGSGDSTFDWSQFRNQLNQTLGKVIASTATEKPPAGSTPAEWLEFQKQMNKTFGKFIDQFTGLHPEQPNATTPDTAEQIDNSTEPAGDGANGVVDNNVNKTIAEIVAEINANKPPPGSSQEDWLAFQKKMNDAFAGMQSKYTSMYQKNKTKKKLKLKADAGTAFDMVAFKDDLNQTLSGLVDLIKSKRPAINSSAADWLAYKKEVKSSVSKLKKDVSVIKKKDTMELDTTEYAAKDGTVFDWMGLKNQINNTIDRLLVDIQTIPPGDPKWASFRDYLNSTFSGFKNKFVILPAQEKLMAIMREDWLSFKEQVNSTIEDALDDIASNSPSPDDPTAKKEKKKKSKATVTNKIAELQENLKAIKAEWLEKAKAATDMMIVTDVRLSATSSASSMYMTIFTFNFCVAIILVRMYNAL